MRLLALVVVILGIAALVFGILFIPQASQAKQKVADSLTAPVTLDNLDATYDQISGAYDQIKASGMPSSDPQYVMILGQRTSLGLAKSNVGVAKVLQTMGIVNIIIGAGLVFAGCALMMRKGQND
jgi:predicted PurR-regulated permease PerM